MAKRRVSNTIATRRELTKQLLIKRGVADVDSFTDRQIDDFYNSLKKSNIKKGNKTVYGGGKTKSLTHKNVIKDGKVVSVEVKRNKKEHELEVFKNLVENYDNKFGLSIKQQLSIQKVNRTFGKDVFDLMEEQNIDMYNISEGWYIDPATGDRLSIMEDL